MALSDRRIVRRVAAGEHAPADRTDWPATVPAVASLLDDGLDLEAVSAAFGLSPEGGSVHARHSTRASESPPR